MKIYRIAQNAALVERNELISKKKFFQKTLARYKEKVLEYKQLRLDETVSLKELGIFRAYLNRQSNLLKKVRTQIKRLVMEIEGVEFLDEQDIEILTLPDGEEVEIPAQGTQQYEDSDYDGLVGGPMSYTFEVQDELDREVQDSLRKYKDEDIQFVRKI